MSNNAIAKVEQEHTDLSVLPPRQPVQATARQILRDHAELASMAYEFADKLVSTKMVPVRYRGQAQEATAAILYGAEIGLGPIQALQNVFEVHGTPAIYARTMQALLEAKGFEFRTVEDTIPAVEVYGWRPESPVIRDKETGLRIAPDEKSRWTIEDAELAGFTRNEKYTRQPRQMLYAKAVTEVCRRLSPATLLGIAYSAEELQLDPHIEPVDHQADADDRRDDVLTVEEILGGAGGQAGQEFAQEVQKQAEPVERDGSANKPVQENRVEAALAKARAASPKKAQEPDPSRDTGEGANVAQELTQGAESLTDEQIAEDAAWAAQVDGTDDESEPSPDPSEEEPEPKRDERPATKAQLNELQELIKAAQFEPTDEGRAAWFAWLSQEVGRNITANNQLKRWEILQAIKSMRDERP